MYSEVAKNCIEGDLEGALCRLKCSLWFLLLCSLCQKKNYLLKASDLLGNFSRIFFNILRRCPVELNQFWGKLDRGLGKLTVIVVFTDFSLSISMISVDWLRCILRVYEAAQYHGASISCIVAHVMNNFVMHSRNTSGTFYHALRL